MDRLAWVVEDYVECTALAVDPTTPAAHRAVYEA
jgi:hypothetical protein